jgi:hypothetical protein
MTKISFFQFQATLFGGWTAFIFAFIWCTWNWPWTPTSSPKILVTQSCGCVYQGGENGLLKDSGMSCS